MIRDAVLADTSAIATLMRDSFTADLHPYMVYTQRGAAAYIASQIESPWSVPDRRHLVVEVDDTVVAYAEFRKIAPGEGFLSYICVAANARRSGYAYALIEHWLDQTSDVLLVSLDVFSHNMIARSAYEKLEFTTVTASDWLRRPLPASAGTLSVSNYHATEAGLATYGFAELCLMGESTDRVGLLGNQIVRLPTLEAFLDDDLLSRLKGVLKQRVEAFAIVPAPFNVDRAGRGRAVEVVLQSLRMTVAADRLRIALKSRR